MKYLIALSMLFFVQVGLAEEMPAYLKDAVITVTLKNGKTYNFSANEYKVVKRGAKSKQQAVQTMAVQKQEERRNRITVHAGVGFDGHKVSEGSNQVDVEERKRAVGAVQLQHKLKDSNFSVSGQIQTNETGLLGVGYDF